MIQYDDTYISLRIKRTENSILQYNLKIQKRKRLPQTIPISAKGFFISPSVFLLYSWNFRGSDKIDWGQDWIILGFILAQVPREDLQEKIEGSRQQRELEFRLFSFSWSYKDHNFVLKSVS